MKRHESMIGRLAASGRAGLAMGLGWVALAALPGGDASAVEAAPAAGFVAETGDPARAMSQVSQSTEVFAVEQALDPAGMIERRLVPPEDLVAGDELRYTIRLRNDGTTRIDSGRIRVETPVPVGARFLPGSAGGAGALVEYALDGATFSPHVPDLPAAVSEPSGLPVAPASAAAGPAPTAPIGAAAAVAEPVARSEVRSEVDDAARDGPDSGAAMTDAAEPALTIRWTYQQPLDPGAMAEVFFHVRLL